MKGLLILGGVLLEFILVVLGVMGMIRRAVSKSLNIGDTVDDFDRLEGRCAVTSVKS